MSQGPLELLSLAGVVESLIRHCGVHGGHPGALPWDSPGSHQVSSLVAFALTHQPRDASQPQLRRPATAVTRAEPRYSPSTGSASGSVGGLNALLPLLCEVLAL